VELPGGIIGRAGGPVRRVDRRARGSGVEDGDKKRFLGKGVLQAVGHVNGELAAAVTGTDLDQRGLDELMIGLDATPTKSRLGAKRGARRLDGGRARAALAAREPFYSHLHRLHGAAAPAGHQYVLPVR